MFIRLPERSSSEHERSRTVIFHSLNWRLEISKWFVTLNLQSDNTRTHIPIFLRAITHKYRDIEISIHPKSEIVLNIGKITNYRHHHKGPNLPHVPIQIDTQTHMGKHPGRTHTSVGAAALLCNKIACHWWVDDDDDDDDDFSPSKSRIGEGAVEGYEEKATQLNCHRSSAC